jgi:wobble nucleotide-excising tRNase
MITHIDIDNFGSFKNFLWGDNIKGKVAGTTHFKRLNILYGRNYAGKTTLSRIFRSLETGELPSKYAKPKFTLHGDGGEVDEDLSTQGSAAARRYDVRVYNSDFVQDNLSFLVSEAAGGDIKAFAIFGDVNKKIALEIALIDMKLGSIIGKTGLCHQRDEKRNEMDRCTEIHKITSEALESKLRSHANYQIKNNRDYGFSSYNIKSIKDDIAVVKQLGTKPLTADEASKNYQLLKQDQMFSIDQPVQINLQFDSISLMAEELLARSLKPTKEIQELLNDATLQAWVKLGIPLHKKKRETCAFCFQDLPTNIWETLGAHFNQEFLELESSIGECIAELNSEIQDVPNVLELNVDQFHAEYKDSFADKKWYLTNYLDVYFKDLTQVECALNARRNSLFQPVAMPVRRCDLDLIQQCVIDINNLIKKHNLRIGALPADQESARAQLRLSDVASLIDTIQYDAELTRIEKLEAAANAAKDAYEAVNLEIERMEANRLNLESRQLDESRGALAVNYLLNNFFGHDGLELVVKDDKAKKAVKFEVMRGDQPAFNLSEGERSLIAFCYFMAKLQESMRDSSDRIIYIDDPISSLDGNHIFFVFSLIDTLIASPVKEENGSKSYRYKQLFTSTHNLEFLKYLKRLPYPKTKGNPENGENKNAADLAYFLLERNRTGSKLRMMPRYLREYITEFQYLFHQIYKCRCASDDEKENEAFYSFGNNLRKFLEIFLFFQYPHLGDQDEKQERLRKYLGPKNSHAVTLICRLVNEFSHLESEPDRSLKPMDVPEMAKVASLILDRMKEKDVEQYESLLLSVGESLVPVTKS